MRSLADEKQTTMLGVLVCYTLIVNGLAALATGFAAPDWKILAILFLAGACTAGGNRLQLMAARIGPINLIAPTHYSQMLWAVVIGALFFAEYPDWISIMGLAIVAGSGLLTLVRERIRLGTVRVNPFGRNRL
jgi:drug/metabolite transporter (DMT)-like permease